MNKRFSLVCAALLISLVIPGQELLSHHKPKDQNVRLAWSIDTNGGVGNDWGNGFEAAYAQRIYPLDQLIVSYSYHNPMDLNIHTVMFSIEELYPISETVVPYGVAGAGYRWSDRRHESIRNDGLVLKLGAGMRFSLTESWDLYGEFAYQLSDKHLFPKGRDDSNSFNWQSLIGFRFNY